MERKLRHLEFILSIENRLATLSSVIKGWAISLIPALFALSIKGIEIIYLVAIYLMLLIFWTLDAHVLTIERSYRAHYNAVRLKDPEKINFDMNTKHYKNTKIHGKKVSFLAAMFSRNHTVFYLSLSFVIFIFCYILSLNK
ncbi:hypothetical protein C0584_01310 [Candidatus Parcubacteria bacterium]|nr:MAG: hypothetical protein C0584_01310 [Candidatus Parcubacteria bacterium]